jgi:hypothetical protein
MYVVETKQVNYQSKIDDNAIDVPVGREDIDIMYEEESPYKIYPGPNAKTASLAGV